MYDQSFGRCNISNKSNIITTPVKSLQLQCALQLKSSHLYYCGELFIVLVYI